MSFKPAARGEAIFKKTYPEFLILFPDSKFVWDDDVLRFKPDPCIAWISKHQDCSFLNDLVEEYREGRIPRNSIMAFYMDMGISLSYFITKFGDEMQEMLDNGEVFCRQDPDFARNCMSDWVSIFNEKNGRGPSSADVSHSALLRRMLGGKKPLMHAPPTAYSYPHYELGEGKEVKIHEMWDHNEENVVIDQGMQWKWIDKEKGLLQHKPTKDTYRYNPETKILVKAKDFVRDIVDQIIEKLEENGVQAEVSPDSGTWRIPYYIKFNAGHVYVDNKQAVIHLSEVTAKDRHIPVDDPSMMDRILSQIV